MVHHVSFPVKDLDATVDFYLAALKPLGYKVFMKGTCPKGVRFVGLRSGCVPDLWFSEDRSLGDAKQGRKPHLAVGAKSRTVVDAFHKAALAAGAECNGPPGLRPEFTCTYYGAFVKDPHNGINLEAVTLKPALFSWMADWSGTLLGAAAAALVGGLGYAFRDKVL